jgi:RNA polymerase sigma-70 factor (ECF subfamily)
MSDITAQWRSHRPYVVNLAYQMLDDIGEAEDIAQETFLRLSEQPDEVIDDVRGWLTVVAGRLCLDQIRSARVRHETAGDPPDEARIPSSAIDPVDRITLDDQVSGALMEVLRRLRPAERVAFVLHDVFGVPFDEIAHTVGRPVGSCRQLARRARMKIQAARPDATPVATGEHQHVVEQFIAACADGDLVALAHVLDPDVWGLGTVLADPAPPPQINRGRDAVAHNLMRYLGPSATLVLAHGAETNAVVHAYFKQQLFAVIDLTIRDGLVLKINATADPAARSHL